jgi:hypothetical protein
MLDDGAVGSCSLCGLGMAVRKMRSWWTPGDLFFSWRNEYCVVFRMNSVVGSSDTIRIEIYAEFCVGACKDAVAGRSDERLDQEKRVVRSGRRVYERGWGCFYTRAVVKAIMILSKLTRMMSKFRSFGTLAHAEKLEFGKEKCVITV